MKKYFLYIKTDSKQILLQVYIIIIIIVHSQNISKLMQIESKDSI